MGQSLFDDARGRAGAQAGTGWADQGLSLRLLGTHGERYSVRAGEETEGPTASDSRSDKRAPRARERSPPPPAPLSQPSSHSITIQILCTIVWAQSTCARVPTA